MFTAGHSFHMFVPGILSQLAADSGIADHRQLGRQSIGGSYVHQHWNRADEKNAAKQALETGEVDVLTLSPIYLPDDGIANFVKLAHDKNPQARVTVQYFWLPYDVYAPDYKKQRPQRVDRNARTSEQLHQEHAEYFRTMDEHVRQINAGYDRPVLFVVPAAQAAIALREKIIAGAAPGLKQQDDLFRDAIGHPTPPLQALNAYCHYAVIYRRSPVGGPMASVLSQSKEYQDNQELDRLLQQLAWDAVVAHPLSGVTAEPAK